MVLSWKTGVPLVRLESSQKDRLVAVGTHLVLIRHLELRPRELFPMPRLSLPIARVCLAVLFGCAVGTPALAVVISSATDTANVKAPANDPGWLNVGLVGGASGVYLGNGWVITAEHVGGNSFQLSDGRSFAISADYNYRVKNSGLPGAPDLRMFRLTQDPGLPAMTIASAAPTSGMQVMMIGSGTDRAAQLHGWNLSSGTNGVQWTETSPLSASVLGYNLVDSNTKRWGQNIVSSNSTFRATDTTQVFMTTFDRNGITFEAQATPGDSGGGVFTGSDDGWRLAGLMITSQPLINQPNGIVTYGSQSAMADLAFYRNDIMSMVDRSAWQNWTNQFDVNGSGRVETRDALAVINELISRQSNLDLSGLRPDGSNWFDVNGDERGNSQDLLAIFNEIRRLAGLSNAAPLAEPMGALAVVPEPSSCLLAVVGAAALLAACRRAGRRNRSL
jgi:hypothetical protein